MIFHNLSLTQWLQLTGDLQIIGPNRPVADTAIVPGTRVRIVFWRGRAGLNLPGLLSFTTSRVYCHAE
jgi:hypothetical protein